VSPAGVLTIDGRGHAGVPRARDAVHEVRAVQEVIRRHAAGETHEPAREGDQRPGPRITEDVGAEDEAALLPLHARDAIGEGAEGEAAGGLPGEAPPAEELSLPRTA